MRKVGLVTVTYNGSDVVGEFMDCFNRLTYSNLILYIIDNASKDATLQILDQKVLNAKTRLIKNTQNKGVAEGNNQGIRAALNDGCDYVLLINNDTTFEETLIEKLVDVSLKYNSAIVAPKMMYHSEPNIIWFAGGYFKKSKGFLNYHIGEGEEDKGQYKSFTTIDYAPTCCTLIPKKVFDDVGLMDEKYFVYFDDTDFFFRIMKDGRHRMVYFNEVSFFHKVGSSTKSKLGSRSNFKFGDFSIRFRTRNQVYYLRKQKSFYATLYIVYFYFRLIARFLFSGKYHIRAKTFFLIQKSFFEGLVL